MVAATLFFRVLEDRIALHYRIRELRAEFQSRLRAYLESQEAKPHEVKDDDRVPVMEPAGRMAKKPTKAKKG